VTPTLWRLGQLGLRARPHTRPGLHPCCASPSLGVLRVREKWDERNVSDGPIRAPRAQHARPLGPGRSGYSAGVDVNRAPAPAVAVFAPVLLLHVELERDADGAVEVHLHAGGQGYWVARMAAVLGAEAALCAPVGGETGDVVSHLLAGEPVELRSVPFKGANATFVHDRREGERVALLEVAPPALGRHDLDQLYNVTLAAALESGACVLAGTQGSAVVDERTYARLTRDLVSTGVPVVVDLSGDVLRAALEGGPDLVKVSHEELLADGWARAGTLDALVDAVTDLRAAGARDVVVSRADAPTIACVGDELVEVAAPRLCALDHRGAGDSMTAALAVSVARAVPLRDALALAAAAGAVNVTRHGLASGYAAAIELLAARVRVSKIA